MIRSTDFEVHRNWLAITYSLPYDKWYLEHTSEWTLDYPPLFAWFEWCLAKIAWYFDPMMLEISNLGYSSPQTILFQRLSVIMTDLFLAYSVRQCSIEVNKSTGTAKQLSTSLFVVIFCNAGLLLVDHIHFQYNGFLYGILFLSIARLLQKRELESAVWFAVLLNLKHIYLYIAPAYFVYFLRTYCRVGLGIQWALTLRRFVMMGIIVTCVFLVSFGPFVYQGQLGQVLLRLFPFKRGLSHAYWAPNFWAIYNFMDKVFTVLGHQCGFLNIKTGQAGMTGGLVQEFEHVVLPSVPPILTLLATVVASVPCLINLWHRPNNVWQFVRALVVCAFMSFMFGWHVHEKAVLLIILPLSLLSLLTMEEARIFIILSIIGHFSLFPLIFTLHETPIKVLALLLHASFCVGMLQSRWARHAKTISRWQVPLCNEYESVYLYFLIIVFIYQHVGHQFVDPVGKLPFLPTMLVSVYCALGVAYCCIKYYCFVIFTSGGNTVKSK